MLFFCVCTFHWTQISESGSYAELLAKRGDFSDFIVEQLQGTEEETDEEEVKEVVDMICLCFLDALASLDLKLSVSESVIYRFQLAHLRVFQSYLVLYLSSDIHFHEKDAQNGVQCTHSKVWKTLEQNYGKEELESKKEQASKGGQKNIHQCIFPFA